jgi:Zn-dependent protease with chaperone function
MKLYEVKYSVDYFPEKVPRQLANDADPVVEDSTRYEYQTEITGIGIKKYAYNQEDNSLIISAWIGRKYQLYYLISFISVPFYWFEDIGLLDDALLLLGGVTIMILGYSALHLPNKQQEFIDTRKRVAKTLRLPYYRRVELTVSRVAIFSLVFGLITIWPWVIPNVNLISLWILATILVSIYGVSRTSPKEQTTPAILFLLMWTGMPVSLPIGNLFLFTQYDKFKQQGKSLIEVFQRSSLPDYAVQSYETMISYDMVYILFFNIIFIFYIIYYGQNILDEIKTRLLAETDVDNITYNKKSHSIFLFLYLTYFLLDIIVIGSYLLGYPIIRFGSHIEFTTMFAPALGIGLYFAYYRYRRYREVREQVLSYATQQSQYEFHGDIDMVIVDDLDNSVFSVDLAFAEEKIVIGRNIFETLDEDELAAIYFHELYHIKHGTKRYQQFANIPIIGPILFLAFINPKKVALEEFRADEYAAKEVGAEAVISAIETTAEFKQSRITSQDGIFDIDSNQDFLKFITTVPIVDVYRPTRRQRVQKLKQRTSSNGESSL